MPPERRISKRLATSAVVATTKPDASGDDERSEDGRGDEESMDSSDDEEEYEVEEILEVRGKRKVQYLIKWKGYDDPTWVSASDAENCVEALRVFHAKLTAAEKQSERTKKRPTTTRDTNKRSVEPKHHKKPHDSNKRQTSDADLDKSEKRLRLGTGVNGGSQLLQSASPDTLRDVDGSSGNRDNGSEAGSVDYPYEDDSFVEEIIGVEEVLDKRITAGEVQYLSRWGDGVESWVHPEELPVSVIETFEAKEKSNATRDGDGESTTAVRPTAKRTKGGKAPTALERSYIGKLVAFSPQRDTWLKDKLYAPVGSAFIVGRVSDYHYARKKGLYEVRWLDSMFQSRPEKVDIAVVRQGRLNYERLSQHPEAPRWTTLCNVDTLGYTAIDIEDEDDLVEYEDYDVYEPTDGPAVSLAEVEKIQSMRFDPDRKLQQPPGLYSRPDGTTHTRLKPQYKHIFEHSASASFFAYLPISFWKQVLQQTNDEAKEKWPRFKVPFTMSELMKFLGILWYMKLVDKGEYARYWGDQTVESIIQGKKIDGLEKWMTLRRFKMLRSAFCFRKGSDINPEDSARDAAVRIRTLLNMLKQTGGRYVDVGRDVSVDEASVAARSKFARHLIMYNPRKPTGKYHFKFYMCCCATTWITLSFRLHAESTLQDRMQGVVDDASTRLLEEEMSKTSKTRQVVLEIMKPYYNTGRVVNCDNYYTSVQLLEALRIKGLYCRGTVKRLSKHFPRHVVLGDPSTAEKEANKSKSKATARRDRSGSNSDDDSDASLHEVTPSSSKVRGEVKRGDFLQAACEESKILAASWCDGNVVNIISNADASTTSYVKRRVRGNEVKVPAPTCLKEYNHNMQGVDRSDQVRARFSVADGHSFKKWYKKLGVAAIDIARVNAYQTQLLLKREAGEEDRDFHYEFLAELIDDMLTDKWQDAPSDDIMLFDEGDNVSQFGAASSVRSPGRESPRVVFSGQSPASNCSGVESAQVFTASRRKRMCIVCRFEGRNDTLLTETCIQHKVSLCKRVHESTVPFGCQEPDWTCWEKFHLFYLVKGVFTETGSVKRSSEQFKAKKAYEDQQKRTGEQHGGHTNDVQRVIPFIEYVTTPDIQAQTPETIYV